MSKIAKIFGLGKPKAPPPLPPLQPLPPLPTRADPEIEAARKRQQTAAKLRKGRRATILTSGRGLEEDKLGTVSRPKARSVKLLGG